MFQLPRKAKEAFHDHLTRLKFEELIDVKEIGMFIFIFCLGSLVTGPSLMSISSLILEL